MIYKLAFLLFIVLLFFSCGRITKICFGGRKVHADILVGDTNIFKQGKFGFVDDTGNVLHPPMQKITLTDSDTKELLGLFNFWGYQPRKACFPIYRHAIILYDQDNKYIGHINICFDCEETESIPKRNCIRDIHYPDRFKLIKEYFKNHKIYYKGTSNN